jgi:hypothetical protein
VSGTIFWSKNTADYLVEVDPEGIAMMHARHDSTGFLWVVPTLYERIKLDDFEPPVSRNPERRAAPGKDAPKDTPQ